MSTSTTTKRRRRAGPSKTVVFAAAKWHPRPRGAVDPGSSAGWLSHAEFLALPSDVWADDTHRVTRDAKAFVAEVDAFLTAAVHPVGAPEPLPNTLPKQTFVFAQRATAKRKPLTVLSSCGQWVAKGPFLPSSIVPGTVVARCAFFKARCPDCYVHWVCLVVGGKRWLVSVNLDPTLDVPVAKEIVYEFPGPFGAPGRGAKDSPKLRIVSWRLQRVDVPTTSSACRPLDALKKNGDLPGDHWLRLLVHHAWRFVTGSDDTGLHNCVGPRGADFEEFSRGTLHDVSSVIDLMGGQRRTGGYDHRPAVDAAIKAWWPTARDCVARTAGGCVGLNPVELARFLKLFFLPM